MSIKMLEGGKYKVDIRPHGATGRRIQRLFDKKADAVAFEKYVRANWHDKEWLAKPADNRRLVDLIDPWWQLHGRNLGRGMGRRRTIEKMARDMGNPLAARVNKKLLLSYRSERLFSGVKASTINRDITTLSGLFNVLIAADEYQGENPIRGLPALKEKPFEVTYLSSHEIGELMDRFEMGSDEYRLTLLCLSTGGRWTESVTLDARHIRQGKVTFVDTKNGRKRTVPITRRVEETIKVVDSGRLFNVDYSTYREILRDVKPDIPKGQAVHILRHTFAAHFVMNGGSVLTLQKILGHANVQQTMTYAHLAPEYLNDATELNPLRGGIHISSIPKVDKG